MMDELELLKKDWQKKDEHLPKLSYEEIHNMIWKKSSSIIKWILIISILELILPNLLYLSPSMRHDVLMKDTGSFSNYYIALLLFHYTVVIYFIYLFYKRYREISAVDNITTLMARILRARKTVKYYIVFCLSMTLLSVIFFTLGIYLNDQVLLSFLDSGKESITMPIDKIRTTALWAMPIIGILIIGIVGGIYFLLYGFLLQNLNRNYRELKKLEV